MADETETERVARIERDAQNLYQDLIDEQRAEAIEILQAIHDEGPHIETQEEYEERVAAARATGIFGDVDTTAGADAAGQDVVAADNEAATVAVAEADAEGLDVTDDEARRQASADAAVTEEGDVIGTDVTPEESEDLGAEANDEGSSDSVVPQDEPVATQPENVDAANSVATIEADSPTPAADAATNDQAPAVEDEAPLDSDGDGESDVDELTRVEKIDAIKVADTAEAVDAIAADDSRKTVTDAAEARKAELAV